jgi:Cap4 SAVED domain
MTLPACPAPFLEIRTERLDLAPELFGWCAGYELSEWRSKQLASHLLEWLPEFALTYSEWTEIRAHNAVSQLAKAALSIYKSDKFQSRGEFGEILLHAMIRHRFKSIPLISKYFYKDSSNDTVKGFDAVHVVPVSGGWELWLGEVKFYEDINKAISDVIDELKLHTDRDYLRGEFAAITNKIDDAVPEAASVRALLNKNTSLDKIFKSVCIPVLLTYDSKVIKNHQEVSQNFIEEFEKEVCHYQESLVKKGLPDKVTIRLFLFPLKAKKVLVENMNEALKKCQAIS